MAHNLAFDVAAGRHAMFSGQGITPWHKLGVVVDGAKTWQEAMELALLDWDVVKTQLTSPYDNSKIDAWGIFRGDNNQFLGSVGNVYVPIQNKYAFEFVDTLLESDNTAHYVSAGALGKGERIWCLAQLNGGFDLGGIGDKHETFLLFTTSHDGSASAICKLTTVRVVCNNTLSMALSGAGQFLRVKHTTNATAKMDAARALMIGAHMQAKDLEDKLVTLAERTVKPASVRSVFKRLFGEDFEKSTRTENKIARILENFESNDNGAFPEVAGTAYNLLNAITEYTDHQSGFRVTDSRKGMSEGAIRAENALFGSGAQLKEQALEVVMQETASDPYHQIMRRYVTVPTDVGPAPKSQGSLLDSIIDGMN